MKILSVKKKNIFLIQLLNLCFLGSAISLAIVIADQQNSTIVKYLLAGIVFLLLLLNFRFCVRPVKYERNNPPFELRKETDANVYEYDSDSPFTYDEELCQFNFNYSYYPLHIILFHFIIDAWAYILLPIVIYLIVLSNHSFFLFMLHFLFPILLFECYRAELFGVLISRKTIVVKGQILYTFNIIGLLFMYFLMSFFFSSSIC